MRLSKPFIAHKYTHNTHNATQRNTTQYNTTHCSAGGWRTLYTLFQMVADGVTDEVRRSFLLKRRSETPQSLQSLDIPADTAVIHQEIHGSNTQLTHTFIHTQMRTVAPGWVIGKSFYARPQGWLPDKWRRPRDTNFFMLFQVRSSHTCRVYFTLGCGVLGGGISRALLPGRRRQPHDTKLFTHTLTHTHINTQTHTQACTADGKVPWSAGDREVPLIGDP